MLLADRRLLITGVLTDRSIAYSVAERAQQEGAEVILTGFGRPMRLTQRIAHEINVILFAQEIVHPSIRPRCA